MTRTLLVTLSLLLSGAAAQAAIIGAGDITPTFNDTDADIISINRAHSLSLAAGSYQATAFNYQFLYAAPLTPGLGGTVQPLLTTFDGSNYKVIALGSTIPYSGDTGFLSTPFGGSSTFTLNSTTTVYAGFFWDGTVSLNRNPIGAVAAATGSSFLRYSGANAPLLGNNISGGTGSNLSRLYDFSVNVEAVPEPSTLVLAGVGTLGAIVMWRKRK